MADITTLVATAKTYMPTKFVAMMTDTQIESYLRLIVDDINAVSPATGWTPETMPVTWDNLVCFGANTFLNLFLVAKFSVEDFNYSDNGLSLSLERGSKIMSVYTQVFYIVSRRYFDLSSLSMNSTGPMTTRKWILLLLIFLSISYLASNCVLIKFPPA